MALANLVIHITALIGPSINTLVLVALIVTVAAIAFVLVEDPLRRQGGRHWRLPIRLGGPILASGCVGLAAFGLSFATQLMPPSAQRISERIAQAANDGPRYGSSAECSALIGNDRRTGCRFGDADAKNLVVLFGDSYAEHLFDGLDTAAREAGWSLRLWTRASCPPVDAPSIDSAKRVVDQDCLAWRETAIRRLIEEKPRLVISKHPAELSITHNYCDPQRRTGVKILESLESVVIPCGAPDSRLWVLDGDEKFQICVGLSI